MSNKIQIDNLYSVFEIVWMLTATVEELFIEMEKKCWENKYLYNHAIDNNF